MASGRLGFHLVYVIIATADSEKRPKGEMGNGVPPCGPSAQESKQENSRGQLRSRKVDEVDHEQERKRAPARMGPRTFKKMAPCGALGCGMQRGAPKARFYTA